MLPVTARRDSAGRYGGRRRGQSVIGRSVLGRGRRRSSDAGSRRPAPPEPRRARSGHAHGGVGPGARALYPGQSRPALSCQRRRTVTLDHSPNSSTCCVPGHHLYSCLGPYASTVDMPKYAGAMQSFANHANSRTYSWEVVGVTGRGRGDRASGPAPSAGGSQREAAAADGRRRRPLAVAAAVHGGLPAGRSAVGAGDS